MEKTIQPREELWKKFSPAVEEIKKRGAEKYFTENFGDWRRGFFAAYDRVICMDEGTVLSRGADEANGDLAIAGSGILYPAADETERLDKLAGIFASLGIKIITAHGDCGAVKVSLAGSAEIPSPENVNQRAREWSEALAARITARGHDCVADYIPAADMTRPEGQHQAVVIYYDATGRFNPARLGAVPPGFVINRAVFGPGYALTEVKLAAGIALGHHGFGDYFSPEHPLIIIPIISAALAGEVDDELHRILPEEISSGRVVVSRLILG